MDTLNIALVGYGGIAEFHANALAQIDGICFKTLVGRRPEPSESFAGKHGFSSVVTDYDAVLNDPEIDAVVITAPSEFHHEMTSGALDAGKHVLCEIPLAMSHKGACEIIGKVKSSGRQCLVAHTRRYSPSGQFIRDFIGSGKTGQVYLHTNYEYWLRHQNVGWTGYQRSWVDDVLFHHGCHLVDFSLWAVGAPVRRVRGELSPLHPETGTSMDVAMLIRYANETAATISLSYNATKGAKANLFVCEAGTLVDEGSRVTLNGDTVFESSDSLQENIVRQNSDFVQAVRENRKPLCNETHGLAALAVLQQVYDQMVTLEDEEKYRRRWGI